MTQFAPDGSCYEWHGQGPVVALVHGLGLNRHMWRWQLPALTPRYRVLAYDLFGHGESAKPPGRPSLKMFSDQLEGLLQACNVQRCAVVGFSLGGMIARRFVLDHPSRASALAILNSAHDRTRAERAAILKRVEQARQSGPDATVEAALERWFTAEFRTQNPDRMDLIRKWITGNDPAVYPEVYRVLAEGDAEIAEPIAKIRCPTLVMTGEDDLGNSPRMAAAMADAIPGARAIVLPGLRHMGIAEDPTAFNDLLVSFLDDAAQN
ncbi:MAG: alpha/beta fold hydrolase [Hyphomicrobiaceae bacterium]